MKKFALILVFVMILGTLAACSGGTQAPPPGGDPGPAENNGPAAPPQGDAPAAPVDNKVYTLKLHHHDPEASPTGEFLKAWAQAINEASNGRLVINIYHGATLGGPRDTVEMVQNGTCDIGWGLQSFFSGVFPVSEALMLPMIDIRTAKQASNVMWEFYETVPAIKAEYSQYKVLLLHANCQSPVSTRKSELKTMSEFAGLNIRGNAGPPTEFIKNLGASPVSIPISELYQAVHNGTLDAVITDWNALNSFQLYETCKYYLDEDIGVSNYFMLMNQGAYDKLPQDLQAILDEYSGRAALEYCGDYWDESDAEARRIITERGDVIYKFSPEEHNKFKAVADKTIADWIATKEAEGIPGQEIYDTLLTLIDKYAGY